MSKKFDAASEADLSALYQDCLKARALSYAPYSKAHVGACIYTSDGKKTYGANIENASYGLTMCAERTAMFSAHLKGYKPEDQIVLGICADFKDYAYPCGACRQVMVELLPKETPVVIYNNEGKSVVIKVKDIMPGIFTKEDLVAR
jgi:cytidine deaminase